MALMLNNQDQNQENMQNQPLNQQMSPGFSPVGQTQQALQRPKNVGSGMFTNIQQLLNVNKAAGQNIAARMGGAMQRDVSTAASGIEKVKGVKEETEKEKQQFATEADKIKAAIEQSRSDDVSQLTALASDENIEKSYGVVQGQTNLADLQRRFGQQSAELTSGLQQAGSGLETGLGTEAGRMDLVRRVIKGPTYTRGQQALDQLIAQTAGGTDLKQALESGRSQIGQTFSELKDVSQAQLDVAQQFQNLAEQTRQNLSKLITETEGLTQEQIKQREQAYLKQIESYEKMAKDILSGKVSEQQLVNWLAPEQKMSIFRTKSPEGFGLFKKAQLTDEEIPTVYEYKELYDAYRAKTPQELRNAIYQHIVFGRPPENISKVFSEVAAKLGKRVDYKDANLMEEVFNELSKTRKATLQDKEYRKVLIDKFLKENFGIDTSTSLYEMDPASLINVDRSNLQERVRTQKETAQINALKRLMQGKQAEQLKTEGIEQSIADVINIQKQKEAIQKKQAQEFENFLRKLGESGTITGHGKASQHRGFGQWTDHYASTTINPLATYLQQNPQILNQIVEAQKDPSLVGKAAAASLIYSLPVLAPFAKDIANAATSIFEGVGQALGFGESASDVKKLAQQRAYWDAMSKYNQLLEKYGHTKKLTFK